MLRAGALAAVAFATLGAGQASAAFQPPPTDGEIKLTSAFAMPISAQEPQCNPEPGGQRIYGTDQPFDPTKPDSGSLAFGRAYPAAVNSGEYNHPAHPDYRPANRRSRDSVAPKLQAGENNDLCFGFTLTPNMEPGFQSTTNPANDQQYNRLNNDPVLPDVRQTHVVEGEDGDDLKSATIDMPTGFAAAPDSVPTCSEAAFGAGNYLPVACPAASQVGMMYARVSVSVGGFPLQLALGGIPNPVGNQLDYVDPGGVYNLPHGPNELARLGASVQIIDSVAPAKFVVRFVLPPEGRVRAITENAPRAVYQSFEVKGYYDNLDRNNLQPGDGQPIEGAQKGQVYVEAVGIRAWGAAGAGNHPTLEKPFAEWGTDCSTPLSADVSIETYAGTKSSIKSNEFKMTGCETLPFTPSVSVTTTEKRPAAPTGATIKVGLGQTTSGPKSALLKDAVVTLPAGLEIGAQVASGPNGLPLCSAAQFAKDSTAPAACPAGSKTGTVKITTPLLGKPLTGNLYLGAQSAVGELPDLYLEASPEGSSGADAPRIKLPGTVVVDAQGGITTTFKDAPQLRFSELELTFPGGENALFTTPRVCGTTKSVSSFTSRASATPVNVESSLTINEDCTGPGFAPSFAMTPSDNRVGSRAPTRVTIAREDRSPWLSGVRVSLPTGFLSDLTAASECSAAAAATGACGDESRIATVTTLAGVGPKPYALTGKMFLTERAAGSVAGAVIVVRAKIGELDLGDVVVPGKIDLRPTDAGLVLTTTAPTRFRGLALNLRSIDVNLDRDNFPLNPTACGPLRATAELTGENGEAAAPTSDVTYAGCGDLPFQPGITAALTGDTKKLGHPGLDVTMTPRAGDSNLKSAVVTLPAGVSTDLNNLKNVCTVDQFNSATCPETTKVGSVAVTVAITPEVVTGTVHLVKIEGSQLPGIGLNITGRYAMRLLSSVKVVKDFRVQTEFASIPDLPIRSMVLKLDAGPKSPLQVGKECTADTSIDAVFGGQGGKTHGVVLPVKCGTPQPVVVKQSLSWSRKTGLKLTLTAPTGKTLRSAKLSLPTGFKLVSKKSTRKKYAKASVSGGKAKVKHTSKTISITGTGAGPSKVTFSVKTKGYVLPKSYKKKLKKGKKLKLKTRVVVNGEAKATSKTLTVKAK